MLLRRCPTKFKFKCAVLYVRVYIQSQQTVKPPRQWWRWQWQWRRRQHSTTHRYTENSTHTLSTLLKRNSLALSPASQTNSAWLTRTAYGSTRTDSTRLDLTWLELGMAYFRFSWNVLAPRATGLNSFGFISFSVLLLQFIHTIFFFFFFSRRNYSDVSNQMRFSAGTGTHTGFCMYW